MRRLLLALVIAAPLIASASWFTASERGHEWVKLLPSRAFVQTMLVNSDGSLDVVVSVEKIPGLEAYAKIRVIIVGPEEGKTFEEILSFPGDSEATFRTGAGPVYVIVLVEEARGARSVWIGVSA